MMTDYVLVVERGFRLLDEMGPENWRGQIDWANLDMMSATKGVLGQLYGAYEDGLDALILSDESAIYYGFALGIWGCLGSRVREREYGKLSDAWKAVHTQSVGV